MSVHHGQCSQHADSQYARNSFGTFIPLGVESRARVEIINDYFDLLAALAAHGKSNGLGGQKLSRYAGWWAFEHYDTGKGFDAGYKLWNNAANATSHLFFAYLRSQTPEPGSTNGILTLPRSLQQLLDSVEYPPQSKLCANDSTKVVMIVDVVSPTPFALLRRAKQFEYRDDDMALRHFAEFQDPVQSLTEECRRVLRAISSTNQSQVSDAATSTSLKDPSWSRFEDIGFGSAFEDSVEDNMFSRSTSSTGTGLNGTSRSPGNDLNRPTTPSWADFLSSGFVDENGNRAPPSVLLPPDKALPPMMSTISRGQSSQSHRRDTETTALEPGELASIAKIELDDAFWWVWISSLAGEEPVARKAAFGRCALIETTFLDGQWMVMEEQVKGAAPEPVPGAYVAERKNGFFSFTKRNLLTRRQSTFKKSSLADEPKIYDASSRMVLDQDRQARIQKAAAELANKKQLEEAQTYNQRRGRVDENVSAKTNSVLTLGPVIRDEASPAMQWAKQYDKKAVREQYLGNVLAGKGSSDFLTLPNGGLSMKRSSSTISVNKQLPPAPKPIAQATEQKPISAHSQVSSAPEEKAVQQQETAPTPMQDPVAIAAPTLPPSPLPPAQPIYSSSNATLAEKTPSVTELPVAQLKRSNESKRSNKSDKDNTATDRTRPKKPGFNAPPPVATNKNSGVKKLFGNIRKRKNSTGNQQLQPDSPTKQDPAIVAARRALEGKPLQPVEGQASPPLSPNHFAKLQNAAKKPSEAAISTPEPSAVPEREPVPVEPVRPEPVHHEPVHRDSVNEEPVHYAPVHHGSVNHELPVNGNACENAPRPQSYEHEKGNVAFSPPPYESVHQKITRGNGYDDLSKTRSEVRTQTDPEFSRFDQGPLADLPAFAPADNERDDDYDQDRTPAFEPPHRPQHQSVYSNVTMQTEATDEEDQAELTQQISPHDRWAQIRRNAAERAARAQEDHHRSRTETRTTDDGETSGEESKLRAVLESNVC